MHEGLNRGWLIFLWLTVSFLTLTCSFTSTEPWLQEEESISGDIPVAVDNEEITSDTTEQWAIDQCNAIKDVSITVENLEETVVDEGHVECDYTHKIINTGDQPIWIIYFKHFYYGGNAPPNDYEFGWNKVMPRQPGESWDLSSFLSDCSNCTPTRYECIYFSIALVYDSPQCRWITEGEVPHRDVLHIAEEEPLLSPCTMISPVSYSQAVPDISEGLRD